MSPINRSVLALSRLEDFKAWVATRGWVSEPPLGDYEVLRLRHPEVTQPIIAYAKGGRTKHVTIGWDQEALDHLVQRWLSERPR